jgi:hypothetical protein
MGLQSCAGFPGANVDLTRPPTTARWFGIGIAAVARVHTAIGAAGGGWYLRRVSDFGPLVGTGGDCFGAADERVAGLRQQGAAEDGGQCESCADPAEEYERETLRRR